MRRTIVAAVLSVPLSSCITSVDQSTAAQPARQETVAVLEQQVESARRIVALLEEKLNSQRALAAAGHDQASGRIDAAVAVEEARIKLRCFELELLEAQAARD